MQDAQQTAPHRPRTTHSVVVPLGAACSDVARTQMSDYVARTQTSDSRARLAALGLCLGFEESGKSCPPQPRARVPLPTLPGTFPDRLSLSLSLPLSLSLSQGADLSAVRARRLTQRGMLPTPSSTAKASAKWQQLWWIRSYAPPGQRSARLSSTAPTSCGLILVSPSSTVE